ncbi:MAG: DNA recombination protein RmuC, partial [Bryobacteraceae bacterium]
MEILVLVVGFAARCLVAWVVMGSRAKAAESVAAELRQQVAQKDEELRRGREELDVEKTARVRAETLLAEAQRNVEEQKKL